MTKGEQMISYVESDVSTRVVRIVLSRFVLAGTQIE